jgi:hypothetical protein
MLKRSDRAAVASAGGAADAVLHNTSMARHVSPHVGPSSDIIERKYPTSLVAYVVAEGAARG